MKSIILSCGAADPPVPVVFALSRRGLGRALGKIIRIAVVGISNFDGDSKGLGGDMLRLAEALREEWLHRAPVAGAVPPDAPVPGSDAARVVDVPPAAAVGRRAGIDAGVHGGASGEGSVVVVGGARADAPESGVGMGGSRGDGGVDGGSGDFVEGSGAARAWPAASGVASFDGSPASLAAAGPAAPAHLRVNAKEFVPKIAPVAAAGTPPRLRAAASVYVPPVLRVALAEAAPVRDQSGHVGAGGGGGESESVRAAADAPAAVAPADV